MSEGKGRGGEQGAGGRNEYPGDIPEGTLPAVEPCHSSKLCSKANACWPLQNCRACVFLPMVCHLCVPSHSSLPTKRMKEKGVLLGILTPDQSPSSTVNSASVCPLMLPVTYPLGLHPFICKWGTKMPPSGVGEFAELMGRTLVRFTMFVG